MRQCFTTNAIPVTIVFILIAGIVLFFYHSNLAGTIFTNHLSSDFVRHAHIDYDSGFVVSWVNEREGTVVGTVSDRQVRQRALQSQPFTNCLDRCNGWGPTKQSEFMISSVVKDAMPDNVKRMVNAVIIQPDTRCTTRLAEGYRSREMLCLSPSSERFVYSLLVY